MLPAVTIATQPVTALTGGGLPLWASAVMIVLGAGLAAMAVLHFRNLRTATRVPVARPTPSAIADPIGPTPQLARELDELGRRLADELDARADRLEKLIAEADDRLARLERLTAATVHASPESLHAPLAEPKHPAAHPAAPAPAAPRSAAAMITEIDPLASEVYKLADAGLLPVQIAQKLSQHTGKVELLLALRRG